MDGQLENLNQKYRKVKYKLGELIYGLYRKEFIRFLYTSDALDDEKEVNKLLRLLDYMEEKRNKIEEICSRETESEKEEQDAAGEKEKLDVPAAVPAEKEEGQNASFEEIVSNAKLESKADRTLLEENLRNLKSGDVKHYDESLKKISSISDKDTLKNMYKTLMEEDNPALKLSVLKLLSRHRNVKFEEIYKMGLNDSDSKVKAQAIRGLSRLTCEKSFPILEPMLENNDPYIRGLTVTCLGIYCGQEGINRAAKLSDDGDPYVRKSLLDMLAVVKAPGMVPAIKKLLKDDNEEVKKSAEAALKKYIHGKKRG